MSSAEPLCCQRSSVASAGDLIGGIYRIYKMLPGGCRMGRGFGDKLSYPPSWGNFSTEEVFPIPQFGAAWLLILTCA
jgi:hypothetical protein